MMEINQFYEDREVSDSADASRDDWWKNYVAPPESMLRTCFHEAGHAVAFWALTRETADYITIYKDGAGVTGTGRAERDVDRPLRGKRRALFLFAGAAAAMRYQDPDCLTWSVEDRVYVVWDCHLFPEHDDPDSDISKAHRACGGERKANRHLADTCKLVDKHWDVIVRLATAIYRRTQEQPFESLSFYWYDMDPLVRDDLTEEELADMARRARRPL